MVDFGGQSLRKAPQKFKIAQEIPVPGMVQNSG